MVYSPVERWREAGVSSGAVGGCSVKIGNLVRDTRGNYTKVGIVVSIVNDTSWVEFPQIGRLWIRHSFLEVVS